MNSNRIMIGAVVLAVAAAAAAQDLSASDYEATPAFVETFAGGATVGKWEMDPANLTGATNPTFITATPGSGVNPAVTALNPVASSSDGGVMMQGNPASTNGTLFGLNYFRCVNSLADGSGMDFTALTNYRIVARLYLYSPTEIASRWQVGPYMLGRSTLFRSSPWYNTASTGGGPGFGSRGTAATVVIPGTSALTTPRWTLMSIMVDISDPDDTNWRLAICVDANGDGVLDEDDPLEYNAGVPAGSAAPAPILPGPFGVFTVGDVNSDGFPLFTDTVEFYEPVTTRVADWAIY